VEYLGARAAITGGMKTLLFVTLTLLYSALLNAGNFYGYPSHSCSKPMRPLDNDEFSLWRYRVDVDRYIR